MTKNSDPKALANLINCLSAMEVETSRLYNSISAKVKQPLLKSLLFSIAEDSKKHSVLLKGVAETIAKTPAKPTNCEKNAGETWRLVAKLNKEIDAKKTLSEEDMAELSEKLTFLESAVGEEYYMFVQMKTLEVMMKEINEIYRIDLSSLKSIFTHIINDEEHHREIISTIQNTLEKKKTKTDDSPMVKYTNPENWIAPFSQAKAQSS